MPGRQSIRSQFEQLGQRLSVKRLTHSIGVVVRAALHHDQSFGLARGVKQLASQLGFDGGVFGAMHHQQRRADFADASYGLETLCDQRFNGQPAPFEAAKYIRDRRKSALHDRAGFIIDLRRQLNRNGAAQRVPKNIAWRVSMVCGQPIPGCAGVLLGHLFGWQSFGAFAKAPVINGQH